MSDLTQIEKVILYETVTDYANFNNRSLNNVVSDISALNPELIFRCFWQQLPVPNSCNDITDPSSKQQCINSGYSYEAIKNSIYAIKQSLPSCIIIGAIPPQLIKREGLYNPKLNTTLLYPATWDMALDPSKWGITAKSKSQVQCEFAQILYWYNPASACSLYDYSTVPFYFPDLTNPQFQEFFLSWVYSQIDAGEDGIWIDMLTMQAQILYNIVLDLKHPSIIDTINAIDYIVNSIHNYGTSIGKYIYVGSWISIAALNISSTIDFLTLTPDRSEVSSMQYNESQWDNRLSIVKGKYPSTKIIGFIDWSNDAGTQLGIFTQTLTSQQRLDFLKITKDFFDKKGITFSYPVHGGYMGYNATLSSFGTTKFYDSKAPEFDTYNTIKFLMSCTQPTCGFTILT
jgi:hypothetical protein